MRTFSRFSSRKVGGMHRGRPTSRPASNSTDPEDTYLKYMRDKLDTYSAYTPERFPQEQPQKYAMEGDWEATPEWQAWWDARDRHERGLTRADEPDIENHIWQTISRQGLDVILEMRPLPDGNHWLLDGRCEFWSDDQWRLIQVYTHPGPLFIQFIASTSKIQNKTTIYPFVIEKSYGIGISIWRVSRVGNTPTGCFRGGSIHTELYKRDTPANMQD